MKLGSRFFASLLACSGLAASAGVASAAPAGASKPLVVAGRDAGPAPDTPLALALGSGLAQDAAVLPAGVLLATRGGLALADPDGGVMRAVGPKGAATAIAADPMTGRILAHVGESLVESVDGGATFVDAGVPSVPGGAPLALAVSGNRILAGPKGGGVSVFDGSAWTRSATGIPRGIGQQPVSVVRALAFVPASQGLLVGVTEAMQVIRSTDGGATWTEDVSGAGRPSTWRLGSPQLVAAGPSLPSTLYLARAHAGSSAGARWRVYRSDDAGATWRMIAKKLELPEGVEWLRPLPDAPEQLEIGTATSTFVAPAR